MCLLEDIYQNLGGEHPEKSVRCRPSDPLTERYHADYSRSFYQKVRNMALRGETDKAESQIGEVLEMFPDYIDAYLGKAFIQAERGDWEGAIDSYERVLSIDPANETALSSKNDLLIIKEDYKQAEQLSSRTADQNPLSEKANLQAAETNFLLNNFERAARYFGQAAKINPANRAAGKAKNESIKKMGLNASSTKDDWKLGIFLLDNLLYQDALAKFQEIEAEEGESPKLNYYLGVASKGLGQLTEAKAHLKKTLKKEPYNQNAVVAMAEVLTDAGELTQALPYYKKILDTDPENRYAYLKMGEYYKSKDMLREADECYDKVIEIYPNDYEAYMLKGIIAIEKYPIAGNPLYYLDKASELNPKYDLPFYYRGKFQLLTGQKYNYSLESFNKAAYLAAQNDNRELLEKCKEEIRKLVATTEVQY